MAAFDINFCKSGQHFMVTFLITHAILSLWFHSIQSFFVAWNFVNRALMSVSYAGMATFLENTPCSSGFSLNIGDLDSRRISNFEVSSESVVQTVLYGNGTGFHFNQLVVLLIMSHITEVSSRQHVYCS
jgi:hypothetical protein